MIMQMVILIYLAILAILDVRKRELPLWILGVGTVIAVFSAVMSVMKFGQSFETLLFGMVPGMIMLCLAGLSNETGVGDGIVLLQVNLVFFLEKTVTAFVISIVAIGLFAAVLLLIHRGNKKMQLPYLPFLWLGCLGTVMI